MWVAEQRARLTGLNVGSKYCRLASKKKRIRTLGAYIAPDGRTFYAKPPAVKHGEAIGKPLPADDVFKALKARRSRLRYKHVLVCR